MASKLIDGLHDNPIIAAINSEAEVEAVLTSNIEVVFFLKSNILELKSVTDRIKNSGKSIFIHADLVDGLSKDLNGLKYIINVVKPDGIITTKTSFIKFAKSKNVIAIQRLFILDSLNLKTGIESTKACNPDAVEILPGIMPSVTKEIVCATRKPVITGGLIRTKNDVVESLKAGAIGVSTSNVDIWDV